MAVIRANRESIDDRFSVLGFTVRTDLPLFEIGLATDPELLKAENQGRRTSRNFFTSQLLATGPAGNRYVPGGRESVYLVPPGVVARFVGQSRLYFGLATYQDKDRSRPISVKIPDEGRMYVSLSGLTERGLRRTARNGANGYGGNGHALSWGGDALVNASPRGGNGNVVNGNGAASGHNGAAAVPEQAAPYSDGYPDELWQQDETAATAAPGNGNGNGNGGGEAAVPAPAASLGRARAFNAGTDDEDSRHGIEGPIPDDLATAQAMARSARALNAPAPEYPQASRFVAAHSSNYRTTSSGRNIERVVIHITDGGANINGTIGWFQNPDANVSAHYVIGQDGEVVQMVRHADVAWHARSANGTSIGIEHVANTRGLNPTPAQMCASAALVTWLCDQYGIPVDRTHILGHSEADTSTTHTGCPNAVWDWDYYMGMVTSRTCYEPDAAPAPTAQGLGARAGRRAYARAQEIIEPFYDAKDTATALQCTQSAFSLEREAWFAGVANTRHFPHSAICQLKITAPDGSRYQGTGFYIGRNRILTCAHNLHGMSRCQIIPGRNGAGERPFGDTTVASSSWRVAPGYSGDGDWAKDLAVIDNVPIAAPNGQFFRFMRMTPSEAMPLAICGYSASSRRVPELNRIIDRDKQHVHGGSIRRRPTPETIDYPILTLAGASGSPVYTIDASGGSLQALICAVHVSGTPVAEGLNRGCFITPDKIDWIEGRARSFALGNGMNMRAPAHVSPRAYARPFLVEPYDQPSSWWDALLVQIGHFARGAMWFLGVTDTTKPPYSAICQVRRPDGSAEGAHMGTAFFIAPRLLLTAAHVVDGQSELIIVPGKNGGGTGSTSEPFGRFRVASSNFVKHPSYGVDGHDNDMALIRVPAKHAANNGNARSPSYFNLVEELMESRPEGVVVSGYAAWWHATSAIEEFVNNNIDENRQHAHGGHIREIPTEGSFTYDLQTLAGTSGSPVYWIEEGEHPVAHLVGVHVAANDDRTNRGCRITQEKLRWIRSTASGWGQPLTFSLSAGGAVEAGPVEADAVEAGADEAASNEAPMEPAAGSTMPAPDAYADATAPGSELAGHQYGPGDYPVELIPQPDKNSCWAAAMAMLLSYRGLASFAPETLANEVGASLATSYGWDLLNAVRDRYRFEFVEEPSNASLYHTPREWARWLSLHGPLWVVIVGAPHAVVVAGIRGDLDDPAASEVKVLNPWDTRVAFDADPVAFNPPNGGYEDWLSFADFAADFGNMAEPGYGNWRVLYLPERSSRPTHEAAAISQSLAARRGRLRLARPPARVHALESGVNGAGDALNKEHIEPIEPSRIAGTRMHVQRGQRGASTWALEQLEGLKSPAVQSADAADAEPVEVHVELGDWPALEGQPAPLPLTVSFRAAQGAVGDVRIVAAESATSDGSQAPEQAHDEPVQNETNPVPAASLELDHGVDAMARIEDEADAGEVAVLKVGIDYRFVGLAEGSPVARIELRLLGDGRYERRNHWVTTA